MKELPEELKAADVAIRKAIADIMEHVDTVRIFVTKDADSTGEKAATLCYSRGQGSWYAQYGQIREWVENVQFDSNVKPHMPPTTDDDEEEEEDE